MFFKNEKLKIQLLAVIAINSHTFLQWFDREKLSTIEESVRGKVPNKLFLSYYVTIAGQHHNISHRKSVN